MEGRHLRLIDGFALPERLFLEPVHDPGDVNAVGTAGAASDAGGADPNGPAAQERFRLTQEGQAYDPVREQIHGKGQRTARGALLTLITGRQRRGRFPGQALL